MFESDVHKKFDSYFELLAEIQRIFDHLNIDPTFLYYSNFYDNTEKEMKFVEDQEDDEDQESKSEFDHISKLNLLVQRRAPIDKSNISSFFLR